MPGVYVGMNGTARKVKAQYAGVNGTARKVTSQYAGVNGIAQKVWGQNGGVHCTLVVSGDTRTGGSWSDSCTLSFSFDGAEHIAQGSVTIPNNYGTIEEICIADAPQIIRDQFSSVELQQGSGGSSLTMTLNQSEYVNRGNLLEFFGGYGSIPFTAKFSNAVSPSPS